MATITAPKRPAQPGPAAPGPTTPRTAVPPAARAPARSKLVLALSGCVMLAFVIAHLGGNLLAFAGSDAFNGYARSLRELGAPLLGVGALVTLVRVALAGALVAHLAAHLRIMTGRASGPVPATTVRDPGYAAYPLPVLRASGGVILFFVALHLAQLTFGVGHPAFAPSDPYRTMVAALQSWPVALGYVIVAAAVGAHLLPGAWTGMRSLGLIRPQTARAARLLAPALALAVSAGLAAVPVAVLAGLLS